MSHTMVLHVRVSPRREAPTKTVVREEMKEKTRAAPSDVMTWVMTTTST